MPKKIITYILFFSFVHLLGCYSFETISYPEFEDELKSGDVSKELFINTNNLKKYHCSRDFLEVDKDSIKVRGKIVISENYEEPFTGKLAIKDIESIELRNFDAGSTILLVIPIVGVTALLIFLISFAQHPLT